VAEIVAALGVIMGLVFLTVQVKENTDITRASSYDRSIDRLNAWRANVVRDPEISKLYLAYSDATTDELNHEDRFRLQVLLTSLWGVYETAFYSHDYGLLGRSEWSRFEVQICHHRGLNLMEWNQIVAPRISGRFLGYIEDMCN
jgi:hypothetical protein